MQFHDNIPSELVWGDEDAMHHDELTVVLPTYKRPDLLRYALESVQSQARLLKIRILIVDNHPERDDDTELLIKSICDRESVCYYKNKENLGPCGNWNRMLELAKTPWCMMLHDDDVLFPERLQLALNMIHSHPKAAVISFAKVDFNGHEGYAGKSFPLEEDIKYQSLNIQQCLSSNPVHVVGLLLNRDIIRNYGGFDNDYYPSIDYECWLRLLVNKETIILANAYIGAYRWFDNDTLRPETVKKMHMVDLLLRQRYAEKANLSRMTRYYLERKSLRHARRAFVKAGISLDEYMTWQKQFTLLKLSWFEMCRSLLDCYLLKRKLTIRWNDRD